jgi:hypothetical protein
MTMYYLVAYRESGAVAECPIPFPTLEAAMFCADLAAYHFGPDYTVAVEEDDEVTNTENNDGSKSLI